MKRARGSSVQSTRIEPLPDGWEVSVIRSPARKKTISIQVKNGRIVVRAPVHTSTREIQQLLADEQARVERMLAQDATRAATRPAPWVRGQVSLYGVVHELQVHSANRWSVRRDGRQITVAGPITRLSDPSLTPVLTDWLRDEARTIICDRVRDWSKRTHIPYGRISIRDQRSRWGSCSAAGNLNFNWRIVLAPADVLDYIVVHELCHRLEMNHSRAFWKHVEQWLPDYRDAKTWLKANGASLYF